MSGDRRRTHLLLSSMAIRMILCLSSGGRDPKLNFFFVVNTFLPSCSETEEESPCIALLIPIPELSAMLPTLLTEIDTSVYDMGQD